MTEKKRKEPTAEQVFASDMWRATDGTGLLVLGQSKECALASFERIKALEKEKIIQRAQKANLIPDCPKGEPETMPYDEFIKKIEETRYRMMDSIWGDRMEGKAWFMPDPSHSADWKSRE